MAFQKNQSVGDGIEVLNALAAAGQPIGSRELARMLEMEHTRANRILKTLADIGMAEQTPSRKYQPGAGVHVLASLSMRGSALLRTALPIMEKHRNPKYTMALGVLWRDKVSYLIHAAPSQKLIEGLGGSNLYPASNSSIGKTLQDPDIKQGYRAIKHKDHYSVAAPIGGNTPLAALAYAGPSRAEVASSARELKDIASLINDSMRKIAR